MDYTKTRLTCDPIDPAAASDVDRRLAELKLNRAQLLEVRDVALTSAANATHFHPINAAGTFSYQDGTWALRDKHVGSNGWEFDRSHGIEAIINKQINTRVVFSNVDLACDVEKGPKPRSKKGSGSERACFGNLFGDLPHYAPLPKDGVATFYLMIDGNGAAELTQPVVKTSTFVAYVERIFLSTGDDLNLTKLPLDEEDRADGFDPIVARK